MSPITTGNDAQRRTRAGTALLAVGLVAAGAGATFAVLGSRERRADRPGDVAVAPALVPGGAGVSVTVAATEGAGGPVAMITGFLIAHAVAYTILLLVLARLARRVLRRLPHWFAVALLAACLAVGIGVAVLTEPYVTPFGQHPHANLLGILS